MQHRQSSNLYIVLCLFVFIGTSLLTSGKSFAADEPETTEQEKPLTSEDNTVEVSKDEWEHFAPPRDDEFDWLQLISGEWLKGELISLYSFKLEFDSDELDLIKVDWEDVRQIRSAGPMSLLIEEKEDRTQTSTVVGILHLKENAAVMISGNKVQSIERIQIISIAKGTGKELDLWSGKISLGANIKSGNSESIDSNMNFVAKRRTSKSRFSLDYTGNYSSAQNIETTNNHRINSFFDIFYSSKFFWRTYSAEYYRDRFKNIDQQYSLGTSFGYEFIRTTETEWEISGGLGSVHTRFVSVGPGEDIETVSPFLEFGTKLDTEVTSWMDYLLDFKFQLVDEESGTYTHHLHTTLSTDITGDLDLDLSLVWDRIARPTRAADGTIPEKDDFQMIVSISYEF